MPTAPFTPPPLPIGWIVPETVTPETRQTISLFLERLRDRGWRIAEPDAAAISDTADLLLLDAARPEIPPRLLEESLRIAARHDIPVLIHGPAEIASRIEPLTSRRVLPLHAERLRQWWGAERMDEELIRNTPSVAVTRVTAGLRWAMVETETASGLAAMPLLHSGEERDDAPFTLDAGTTLRDLSEGLRQGPGLLRSVACAAVNAGIPLPATLSEQDGLLEGNGAPGGRTVIVGRFPRLPEKRPNAIVLEKNPGPEDYPAEAAPYVIPGAEELICTASAWCNGSLPPLLDLAKDCRVTLVGPGTPLSPILHDYGIDKLAGFIVENRAAVRDVVAAGRGVKDFKTYGRQVQLARDPEKN